MSPAHCKLQKATVRSRRIFLPRIFMGNLHVSTKIISFCIKSCTFSSSYNSEPKKSLICFSPVHIHLPLRVLPTALPCFHPSHHDCIRTPLQRNNSAFTKQTNIQIDMLKKNKTQTEKLQMQQLPSKHRSSRPHQSSLSTGPAGWPTATS